MSNTFALNGSDHKRYSIIEPLNLPPNPTFCPPRNTNPLLVNEPFNLLPVMLFISVAKLEVCDVKL